MIGSVRAQSEEGRAKSEPADPTGSWTWDYTFNDNTADFFLKLDRDGEQIVGEYTAFGNATDIDETKLENDELSFIARREFNGNKFVVRFNGKVEPDDIVGKVVVDFGEGPREFDWHARRVVDAEDVLGVWKLRLETPNGVIEPQITISKDGNKLHGEYVSPFGERDAKNLELKDNELTWEISSNENDEFDFKVVYRGKPRGNSIAGSNEFDFGGNAGTMEFTGQRTRPDTKEAVERNPADDAPTEAATPDAQSSADAESSEP